MEEVPPAESISQPPESPLAVEAEVVQDVPVAEEKSIVDVKTSEEALQPADDIQSQPVVEDSAAPTEAQGDHLTDEKAIEEPPLPPAEEKVADVLPLPPADEKVADVLPTPPSDEKVVEKDAAKSKSGPGDEGDESKDTVGPIPGEKQAAAKTGENLHTTHDTPDVAHDLGESVSRSGVDVVGNAERREETTGLTGGDSREDCGACKSADGALGADLGGGSGTAAMLDPDEGQPLFREAQVENHEPILSEGEKSVDVDLLEVEASSPETVRESQVSGTTLAEPLAPSEPDQHISISSSDPAQDASLSLAPQHDVSLGLQQDVSLGLQHVPLGTQHAYSLEAESLPEMDVGNNIPVLDKSTEVSETEVIDTSQLAPHETETPEVQHHGPSQSSRDIISSESVIATNEALRSMELSGGENVPRNVDPPIERTGDSQALAIVEGSGAVGSASSLERGVGVAGDETLPGAGTSAAESAEKLPVPQESRPVAMKEDSPTQQPVADSQDKTPIVAESSAPSDGTFWRSPSRRKSQAKRVRDAPGLFWPARAVMVSHPVEAGAHAGADRKEPPVVQASSSRGVRETLRADSPVIPGMFPMPPDSARPEAGIDNQTRTLSSAKTEPPVLNAQSQPMPTKPRNNSSHEGYLDTKAGLGLGAAVEASMDRGVGLAIAQHASLMNKGNGKTSVNRAALQEAPRIIPQQNALQDPFTNTKPSDGTAAFPALAKAKVKAFDSGLEPNNGAPLRTRKSYLAALDHGQERSATPPIVLPTMADLPPSRPPVRARQLRRARKLSIARAEEEIAAAVVIYASADAMSPPQSPTREARPFHFPENGLSREPSSAARPQDWQMDSPNVNGSEEDKDLRQSVADLLTDNDRSSDDKDRERRRRRKSSHHHSSRDGESGESRRHHHSSRDGESGESRRLSHSSSHSHRHHRSRADSERSSRTPPD
ncbi:hypothetical protein IMZ48_03675, partial [Candidatus Bathyarchaeota archaeon]|nr:hypothetical protein [Candidatus Bathyarchaeota archaeon]